MPDKSVSVTIGKSISVDQPSMKVRKHVEKVRWVNEAGTEFGIVLPAPHPAPVGRKEGHRYVCTSEFFANEGVIKYDVTSPGVQTLDPDLEIIP